MTKAWNMLFMEVFMVWMFLILFILGFAGVFGSTLQMVENRVFSI